MKRDIRSPAVALACEYRPALFFSGVGARTPAGREGGRELTVVKKKELYFGVWRTKHMRNRHRLLQYGPVALMILFAQLPVCLIFLLPGFNWRVMIAAGVLAQASVLILMGLGPRYAFRRLHEAGYSEFDLEDAKVFWNAGGFFLRLPRHEEVAILPGYDPTDIRTLLQIMERQLAEAKPATAAEAENEPSLEEEGLPWKQYPVSMRTFMTIWPALCSFGPLFLLWFFIPGAGFAITIGLVILIASLGQMSLTACSYGWLRWRGYRNYSFRDAASYGAMGALFFLKLPHYNEVVGHPDFRDGDIEALIAVLVAKRKTPA